jgi:hypothetical protein
LPLAFALPWALTFGFFAFALFLVSAIWDVPSIWPPGPVHRAWCTQFWIGIISNDSPAETGPARFLSGRRRAISSKSNGGRADALGEDEPLAPSRLFGGECADAQLGAGRLRRDRGHCGIGR